MFEFYTVKLKGTDKYVCRVPDSVKAIASCWTDRADLVKVYVKIGPARSIMTRITNLCTQANVAVPDITLVHLSTIEVEIDESERVTSVVSKLVEKAKQNAKYHEDYRIRALEESISRQQTELDRIRNS